MKLFVYRFKGVVHKVIAQSVISDVEILFEGNVRAEIPRNIKDLLKDQKDLDDIDRQDRIQKRQLVASVKAKCKSNTATLVEIRSALAEIL